MISHQVGQVVSNSRELNDLLAMLSALDIHARPEHRQSWLAAILWLIRLGQENVAVESTQGKPLDLPGRPEIATAVTRALAVASRDLPPPRNEPGESATRGAPATTSTSAARGG